MKPNTIAVRISNRDTLVWLENFRSAINFMSLTKPKITAVALCITFDHHLKKIVKNDEQKLS